MTIIDVKEAVKKATEYAVALYAPEQLNDLRLEEVELGDDGFWYVTLGFSRQPPPNPNPLLRFPFPDFRREYKVVKIDAQSGEVKALKMRSA